MNESGETANRRKKDGVVYFLEIVAALTLFSLMAITCVDVVGRYFFNSPLGAATELTRMMMAIVVFCGLPVACMREEHITVDLLDAISPRGIINARQTIMNLIAAVAMAGVAYRVWILAFRAKEYGDTTEFLQISLFYITLFICIMSAVTALALLYNAKQYILGRGPMSPKRLN
jgi:TRAP-type transport system small permease protein